MAADTAPEPPWNGADGARGGSMHQRDGSASYGDRKYRPQADTGPRVPPSQTPAHDSRPPLSRQERTVRPPPCSDTHKEHDRTPRLDRQYWEHERGRGFDDRRFDERRHDGWYDSRREDRRFDRRDSRDWDRDRPARRGPRPPRDSRWKPRRWERERNWERWERERDRDRPRDWDRRGRDWGRDRDRPRRPERERERDRDSERRPRIDRLVRHDYDAPRNAGDQHVGDMYSEHPGRETHEGDWRQGLRNSRSASPQPANAAPAQNGSVHPKAGTSAKKPNTDRTLQIGDMSEVDHTQADLTQKIVDKSEVYQSQADLTQKIVDKPQADYPQTDREAEADHVPEPDFSETSTGPEQRQTSGPEQDLSTNGGAEIPSASPNELGTDRGHSEEAGADKVVEEQAETVTAPAHSTGVVKSEDCVDASDAKVSGEPVIDGARVGVSQGWTEPSETNDVEMTTVSDPGDATCSNLATLKGDSDTKEAVTSEVTLATEKPAEVTVADSGKLEGGGSNEIAERPSPPLLENRDIPNRSITTDDSPSDAQPSLSNGEAPKSPVQRADPNSPVQKADPNSDTPMEELEPEYVADLPNVLDSQTAPPGLRLNQPPHTPPEDPDTQSTGRLQHKLNELRGRLPLIDLPYLERPQHRDTYSVPPLSADISSRIMKHTAKLKYQQSQDRKKFKQLNQNWLQFCARLDSEKSTSTAKANGPTAQKDDENVDRPQRRNRSNGDAVRTEAEFMEILANLKMETARDPLVRAELTSVCIPDMIFDPNQRHLKFRDTNNQVLDKSTLLSHLQHDDEVVFSPEEHKLFSEGYVLYPKEFNKIAEHMKTGRSFHECVMHYYRTKKEVDYKLLLHKSKVRGRRGRRKKTESTPRSAESEDASSREKQLESQAVTPAESPIPTDPTIAGGESDTSGRFVSGPVVPQPAETAILPRDGESIKLPEANHIVDEMQVDAKLVANISAAVEAQVNGVAGEAPKLERTDSDTLRQTEGIDALATLALASESRSTKELDAPQKRRTRRKTETSEKVTSYWSAQDTKKFERLIELYGTHWDHISKHMETKSVAMVKNYFNKFKEQRGYSEVASKADSKVDKTGVYPVYVGQAPPPPLNGPSPGFFMPRRKTVPVQSALPEDQIQGSNSSHDTTPPKPKTQPAAESQRVQNPVTDGESRGSTTVTDTSDAKASLKPLEMELSRLPSLAQIAGVKEYLLAPVPQSATVSAPVPQFATTVQPSPTRPIVVPRSSRLSAILSNENAALPPLVPRPNSDCDSYGYSDRYMPSSLIPTRRYPESHERGGSI